MKKSCLGPALLAPIFCCFILIVAQVQTRSESLDSRAAEARATLNQIENALKNIKEDCGASVIVDRRSEVSCKKYGRVSVGEAWNNHLVAAGFPDRLESREALAKRLHLDPRVSLVLAFGGADEEKISYLIDALRSIAGGR